jgi:hypothetical protein
MQSYHSHRNYVHAYHQGRRPQEPLDKRMRYFQNFSECIIIIIIIIIITIPITLICIIIIISNILLSLIPLNYYCYYNILSCNSNDFCSQLSFPIISVCLFVCFLQLCAPAIYRTHYIVSVHYVPMYICTVLCL